MATYKPLSTDFKDDILASQNSKRKYTQVNNSDGTVSFQDSTAYSQVGSSYGAKEVNEERKAINNVYANKLVTLDEINLVTEPGFFVDAKAVKELNSKSPKVFKSSDSDFISFVAPFDCIAIVSFSCAGWGMNGEFLEFKIKNDQSILQEMFVHTGACSGNNNVYIPLNAKSGFSGLKKGSSYSFSRQNLYSSFGMSWNRQWSAVCLPI